MSSVSVPTYDEFTAIAETVTELNADLTTAEADIAGLKSRPPISVKERPWEEVVVSGGYNDAAVQASMDTVMAAKAGTVIQKTLVLPPGDFHLTKPLLTSDSSNKEMLQGLRIVGQGKRVTNLYWDNAATSASDPMQNNFIQAVRRLRFFNMSGFSAYSSNLNNNFAYLYSDTAGGYNQAWNISDAEFSGSWNRVFGLDGGSTANLNSEFHLDGIFTATNSVFQDAFFRSGGISGTYNQQNQFMNYWITNSGLTLSKGTVFRFDRGGSIRVQNGSYSAASPTSGPITWFYMPVGDYNNRAATQLSVRDVKFEPKAANHKVIDCAWGSGTVTFEDCNDGGSIQNAAGIEYNLHRYVGQNPWGFGGTAPVVRYRSCFLAGYHLYEGADMARGNIVYDGSYFFRGVNGDRANAVQGTSTVLRWTKGTPKYRFQDCDNIDNLTNI